MKESSSGSSGAIRGNVLRFLDHASDAFQAVGPPPQVPVTSMMPSASRYCAKYYLAPKETCIQYANACD
jgi:hypothetical protein